MTAAKRGKRWAYLIGIGLALFPIHNSRLTDLVTSGEGEVGFFLPSFGAALWILGSLLFITWNWEAVKQVGLGDRKVWIPLLVIVAAVGLSGVTADSFKDGIARPFAGGALFSLYITARVLGRELFVPLAVGAAIACAGVIAHAIVFPGYLTGGYVFEYNYDVVVGYVLLGAALFVHRWQWVLVSLALVAIFLTGSPEGIFAVGVVGLFLLIRRDWSKRLLLALVPVAVVAVIWFSVGWGQDLYSYAVDVGRNTPAVPETTGNYPVIGANVEEGDLMIYPVDPEQGAVSQRLSVIKDTLLDIKPLGEGYNLTGFGEQENVHNVPLVLVQQLGWPGVLAGLAWLWVSVFCLIRTRWKYVWVCLIALCVFDHFVWTQLCCLWWPVVGASGAGAVDSDKLFS